MRARVVVWVGMLVLALTPSAAHAQLDAFLKGVSDLAAASVQSDAPRTEAIRSATDRMKSALREWDRTIRAVEAQTDKALSGSPDRLAAYQAHLQLAVMYRARGRIADALREFDAATALQPGSSDLQIQRALTLEVSGRAEEAAKAFRAAWTLDPHEPAKAYYLVMRASGRGGSEGDAALALLADAYRNLSAQASPPSSAPFLAVDPVADTIARTPVVGNGETGHAFAFLRDGKFTEAVAALERAEVQLEPKDVRLKRDTAAIGESPLDAFVRAQHDEAENRITEARRGYEAALAGALAGRSIIYVAIARLAQVDGDLAAATAAFARAVQLDPNQPNIHKEAAAAYAAAGRADEAFAELMAALLIAPRDAQAHAAVGHLYLDTGRDAEAVTAFSRALAIEPDAYEVRYALATALTRVGDTAEAARQLEIFDRVRRERLERRRRGIADEVEKEESVRRGLPIQGTAP